MGFFASMLWGAVGILVVFCYAALMGKYVSKGFHIGGKPIEQEKYQSTKTKYNMGFIFIIFIFIAGPFIIPKAKEDPNAWKTKDNTTMAYSMMQQFVKKRLVSPDSAKFQWITEPDCTVSKDGFDYAVSSWVDSHNAFGVMVRNSFTGIIRQIDHNNWELRSLDFEE